MPSFSRYLCILILGLISQFSAAQPATFENNLLTVPQVAALVDGELTYYNDIQFTSDLQGNFTLRAAQQSNLVSVETVTVNVAESLPVQVSLSVAGNKSVPCVELQAPAIFNDKGNFTIALAETTLGPAETCIAVLAPFETNITLDVTGVEPGTYSVNVNGIVANFSL